MRRNWIGILLAIPLAALMFLGLPKAELSGDVLHPVIALLEITTGFPTLTVSDMFNFLYKLLPLIVFEMLYSISLYKSFCVASVYVFTRQKNRGCWFIRQAFFLLGLACLFMALYLSGLLLGLFCKYGALPVAVFICAVWQWILFTLYAFLFTLMTNCLAILLGSHISMVSIYLLQFAAVCVLPLLNAGLADSSVVRLILILNPISNILIPWHDTVFPGIGQSVSVFGIPFPLWVSILYFLILLVFSITYGALLVRRIDIALEDKEAVNE